MKHVDRDVCIERRIMMKTLFHVTPISKLDSIMEKGLIPQLGERAIEAQGETEGVFLFTSYENCEHALCNWLGEEFEDLEEDLITLQIELPTDFQLDQEVEWEMIARTTIEPKYISVFKIER